MSNHPLAIYVHTPFCPTKCGYCDFNSYAMDGEIVGQTVRAIVQEIKQSPHKGRPAKTIFFGGGTPTFLSSPQLTQILEAVLEVHPPIPDCEITSEANPGTVDIPKFQDMVAAGFNRISLGAQSFNPSDLHRLGRVHEASDIARAVGAARKAGFNNLNLDLMFALPGQSPRAWKSNLDLALQLQPNHLSLYCLTIEPNTRYYRLHLKGMLDLPNEDAQVRMYDQAIESCQQNGLGQYEISNFAESGKECQHNCEYWLGHDYLAYGPGAVGCVESESQIKTRYTNIKHPKMYCEAIEESANLWCDSEQLDISTQEFEKLMLGIRLNAGISRNIPHDQKSAQKLTERGWLEPNPDRLILTPAGRHFCSEVTAELAPA